VDIVKRALERYAGAITRPFFSDRSVTVGASEIGQCARKTFWVKHANDPARCAPRDEGFVETWGSRQRGTVFEDQFWVPAMRAMYKQRLKCAGTAQRTFGHDFLSATPDGVIIDLTPEEQTAIGTKASQVLVECKTKDPRTNLTEPKPEHVYQAIVQLGVVRAATPWKPDRVILSYTDASFWDDVKEFVIPFDAAVYERARLRAKHVMTAESAADTKPEGWIAGGHECRYCAFTTACGIERRNLPYAEPKPIDAQLVAEITDMAREIKEAEVDRDNGEARMRELQNKLKDRLREKGIRKVPGVVAWSEVNGRNGYDNKALLAAAKAAGIDVEQFATKGADSDRLTIQIGA
jgi:hypothetical protein